MRSLSETKGAPTSAQKRSQKDRSPGFFIFVAPLVHGFLFSMGCRFCCSADSGPVVKSVKSAYTLEKTKGSLHCIAASRHILVQNWQYVAGSATNVAQISQKQPVWSQSWPQKIPEDHRKAASGIFLAQENSRSRFFSILWNFVAPKLTLDRAKRTRNEPEGGPSAGKRPSGSRSTRNTVELI